VIRNWHIIIQGFKQDEDLITGCEYIWKGIRHLTGITTSIQLRHWNDNWKALAAFIDRNSTHGASIRVYAYSWGCGYGLVTLAKYLAERGLSIRHAVLCDPVWRWRWAPAWLSALSFRSIFRGQTVPINSNILEVSWCFQIHGTPRGHTPKAVNPDATIIHPGVLIKGASHTSIDEMPWFTNKALEVAAVC
jgi:hypothetical protein